MAHGYYVSPVDIPLTRLAPALFEQPKLQESGEFFPPPGLESIRSDDSTTQSTSHESNDEEVGCFAAVPEGQHTERELTTVDKVALHISGCCVPCLYFTRKEDGCRKGDACAHCHFCTPQEARTRRNRMQALAKKARR